MFQKGDKNITGDVKIGGKADRLEDVLDPFRRAPLGESQNFRSARDHVHAGRRRFTVGQAEIIETVVSLCRAAQCVAEIKDTALTFVFGIDFHIVCLDGNAAADDFRKHPVNIHVRRHLLKELKQRLVRHAAQLHRFPHRLGASVVGFSDSSNTSLGKKGETLADTISVISTYVDAIVMRHPQEGAARLATEFSGNVPVLNAGDGSNQHPTQTLLDLFTIQETQGRLDNLQIAMVGDLKYGRTVHSLTQALAKFNGNRFFFIAPDALAMPQYILDMLDEKGIPWSLHASIEDVMGNVDILYMTRVQKERLDPSEYANVKAQFVLRASDLEGARDNMKVLHPLPRIDEITTDVDKTPHAWYFQQAGNGIFARQALLALVLNRELAL